MSLPVVKLPMAVPEQESPPNTCGRARSVSSCHRSTQGQRTGQQDLSSVNLGAVQRVTIHPRVGAVPLSTHVQSDRIVERIPPHDLKGYTSFSCGRMIIRCFNLQMRDSEMSAREVARACERLRCEGRRWFVPSRLTWFLSLRYHCHNSRGYRTSPFRKSTHLFRTRVHLHRRIPCQLCLHQLRRYRTR